MTDLPWDIEYFGDPPDTVAPPVAIAADQIQDTSFRARWNAVEDPDVDHYEVDVSTSEDFDVLVPVDAPTTTDDIVKTIASLAPETEHFFRVRAVKTNGTVSANSNTISVTTDPLFVAQGGDTVTYFEDVNETVHIFDNSGDFEVLQGSSAVRRLIVGGGGQGGGVNGTGVSCGGGGGGGVLDLDEVDRPDELDVDVYPVVVGAPGQTAGANNVGEDGGDSSFAGDTAEGGGHGGSTGSNVGNGGSGGGATNASGGPEAAGTGTVGQGHNGGTGNAGVGGGGGGGGAAEPGNNGTAATGGKGGDGVESDITGETVKYGAGGGGSRPVDAFGTLPGTTAGAGGDEGGAPGQTGTPATGIDATGRGNGGGGALGNRAGGKGTKGIVAIRYVGRGVDSTVEEPEVDYVGPITFDTCSRLNVVEGVEVRVDCNARIDSGIYPDYQRYLCPGGGIVQSSRSMRPNDLPSELPDDPLPGGENDITRGTLVFRFSQPIKAFKITRKVTAGTDAVPVLIACDDYTVVPHPGSSIPGSSKDGAIVNNYKQSPAFVYYPTPGYTPAQNLAAEEVQEIIYPAGFTCLVILQATKFPSEFVDPMFSIL